MLLSYLCYWLWRGRRPIHHLGGLFQPRLSQHVRQNQLRNLTSFITQSVSLFHCHHFFHLAHDLSFSPSSFSTPRSTFFSIRLQDSLSETVFMYSDLSDKSIDFTSCLCFCVLVSSSSLFTIIWQKLKINKQTKKLLYYLVLYCITYLGWWTVIRASSCFSTVRHTCLY